MRRPGNLGFGAFKDEFVLPASGYGEFKDEFVLDNAPASGLGGLLGSFFGGLGGLFGFGDDAAAEPAVEAADTTAAADVAAVGRRGRGRGRPFNKGQRGRSFDKGQKLLAQSQSKGEAWTTAKLERMKQHTAARAAKVAGRQERLKAALARPNLSPSRKIHLERTLARINRKMTNRETLMDKMRNLWAPVEAEPITPEEVVVSEVASEVMADVPPPATPAEAAAQLNGLRAYFGSWSY